MCLAKFNWKTERIKTIQESLGFFSNARKFDREKWVVKQLLHALCIEFKEEELMKAGEPIDVAFRDAGFQVKELLDIGRRRTDEFNRKLESAKSAKDDSEFFEFYTPRDISFSEVDLAPKYRTTG